MGNITKDLNLTADQKTRVQAIEKEQMQQMQQMQALRESGKTEDREAQMQRMRSFE
jgi:protein CpxP